MKTRSWRGEHSLRNLGPPPSRARADLSASALISNYRVIQDLVPGLSILPMIKADGYGHGAAWVARNLIGMPGLYGFGVATLQEGGELRQELSAKARKARIIVFSGAAPWTDDAGPYCERYGLTPVISAVDDWHAFVRGGWPARIPYELKFNTGMNRLGMPPAFASQIAKALNGRPSIEHPQAVLSHLAQAEEPDSPLSRAQRERFVEIRSELSGALPSTQFHLGNSAAIWNEKKWKLASLSDAVRPGLSLYGVRPWLDAPVRGLQPVMSFRAQVIARATVKPGERIGYGGTFKVDGKSPIQVAMLAVGYADGLHRVLSSRGSVAFGNRMARILGVVSMDLCAVECPQATRVGDEAEVFGPQADSWALAQAAGTLPYELLTSVSARVERSYG